MLNSLIDCHLFRRKKRLYMHVLLIIKRLLTLFKNKKSWMKLCNLEIEGKLFNVIRNISISDAIHVFDKY